MKKTPNHPDHDGDNWIQGQDKVAAMLFQKSRFCKCPPNYTCLSTRQNFIYRAWISGLYRVIIVGLVKYVTPGYIFLGFLFESKCLV